MPRLPPDMMSVFPASGLFSVIDMLLRRERPRGRPARTRFASRGAYPATPRSHRKRTARLYATSCIAGRGKGRRITPAPSPPARGLPAVAALPVTLPVLLGDIAPRPLALGGQPLVGPRGHPGVLPGQLAVAGQPAFGDGPLCDGLAHRAARLGLVRAIGEPAGRRQLLDVAEGALDALRRRPQSDTAQAGGVDERAAAGQRAQLPVHGGVPALTVTGADRGGGEHLRAEQGIGQGGFARAGRPEQG